MTHHQFSYQAPNQFNQYGNQQEPAKGMSKKKKIAIGAGVGVVALFAIGVANSGGSEEKTTATETTTVTSTAPEEENIYNTGEAEVQPVEVPEAVSSISGDPAMMRILGSNEIEAMTDSEINATAEQVCQFASRNDPDAFTWSVQDLPMNGAGMFDKAFISGAMVSSYCPEYNDYISSAS